MANAVCPVCEKEISVMALKCPHCDWDFKPDHEVEKHNTRFLYSHWATLILGGGLGLSVLVSFGLFIAIGVFAMSGNFDNAFICILGLIGSLSNVIVILRVLDQPEKK